MKDDTNAVDVEEKEIKFLDLLHVIVKRKLLIIRLCVGVAILSAVLAMVMPNLYTATAKVLPPQKENLGGLSSLLSQGGSLGNLAGIAGGALGGTADLYMGILKSRSVADGVIKKLDLKKRFHSR